jgi:hypothetical protein
MIPICPCRHSHFDRADFFHRLLRTKICFSDEKYHVLNKLKRVRQQQVLHFAVVKAAPVFSLQKRPSNFDLQFLGIIPVEPRRSDDSLTVFVDDDKCAAGFERFFEENPEYFFLVTIVLGMLLPNERIRCNRKQLVPIVGDKRPKLDELASQMWLKIKRHCICGFGLADASQLLALRHKLPGIA